MIAKTDPSQYSTQSPVGMTVYPLEKNKRPIGFAPWPEPKKKTRPRAKPKA